MTNFTSRKSFKNLTPSNNETMLPCYMVTLYWYTLTPPVMELYRPPVGFVKGSRIIQG